MLPSLKLACSARILILLVLCSTSEQLKTLAYDLFREIDTSGDGNSSRSAPHLHLALEQRSIAHTPSEQRQNKITAVDTD